MIRRPIYPFALAATLVTGLSMPLAAGPAQAQAAASKLSPEAKAELRTLVRACRTDIRRFCSGVEPGEGRMMACMSAQEADLSAGCATAIADARARREKAAGG
ncbi:cysteine rich repeat-containing protein [Methylobrevis pamukkalensis]|uniref:Cysteine rich repeat protein n=1 Tax=Methylobrevis pamukkalensis TaxID=1439726 RepID=A0A1E3H6M3_9HYPH|nr:cysteine rich repeat-containing protein [Methylobrevis pamukkalensis]ODN71977.1 hypothetical protein A6302_00710 [Methylobrevis pamukkalensis]